MHDETDDAETEYPPFESLAIRSAPHWLITKLDEYAKAREPGRRRLIERLGHSAPRHLAKYDDDTLSQQLVLVQLAEMSWQDNDAASRKQPQK